VNRSKVTAAGKQGQRPKNTTGFGSPVEMALRCLETNRKPRKRDLSLTYQVTPRGRIEFWISGDFVPGRHGRRIDERAMRQLHGWLRSIVDTLDAMRAGAK